MESVVSAKAHQAKLDQEISRYAKKGYHVTSRSESGASLYRPRRSRTGITILLLICTLGLWLLVEPLMWILKPYGEKTVYLRLTDDGKVKTARG